MTGADVVAIARAELLDVGSATKLTADLALVALNKYLAQLNDALILWNAKEVLGAWSTVAFVENEGSYSLAEGVLTPEFKCPIMATKELGFVYIRGVPLPALTDYQFQLSEESERSDIGIGTGDGVTVTFGDTLTQLPVRTNTVVVTYISSDVAYKLEDDGAGAFAGDGTGTIDYTTGAISVTCSNAPDDGDSINCHYQSPQGTPMGWIIRHSNAATGGVKQLEITPAPDENFINSYPDFQLNYFRDFVPLTAVDNTMPCDDRFRYDASEYLKLFTQLVLRKVSNVDMVLQNWVRSRTFSIISMDRPNLDIDYDSTFLNTCNFDI